ncbi:hypothetical protein [Paenibacillus sedimenti]|uniref:Uncharacterized protein n=1 Tax=Paenibacillus sedimenti TaxID=2770274 RepID=A0A926KWP6_9BACL|nr:hypothetical protein [Paenibacillus sedimenti]MBD0384678.1 hypothetical protein [Paenibacillus sedimenti]
MNKTLIAATVMSVVAVSTSAAILVGTADAAVSKVSTASAQPASTGVEAASVEYMKRTVLSPDGKIVNVQEDWQDTKASRYKGVLTTPSGDDPDNLITTVEIMNGKQGVSYRKDSDGKIIEGAKHTHPQASKPISIFAIEKERYTRQEWKNQEKVTENGVTYTKLTKTYTSVGTKYKENIFLNQSGLPVKGTIFTIKGGKSTLLFKVNYQYDKLKADNALFDVDSVKLPEK